MKTKILVYILVLFSVYGAAQNGYEVPAGYELLPNQPEARIHPTAIVHPSVVLDGDIEIGKYTFIGPETCIWGKVNIGDFCRIYMNVSIRGHNINIGDFVNIFDNVNIESGRNWEPYHEFPDIGDYSWINHGAVMHGTDVGEKAVVGMGAALNYGCVVGDGAIVMEGSGCHVDMKIPANSVAEGVPAVIIKENITDEDREEYLGLNPYEFIDRHADGNRLMHEMRNLAREYAREKGWIDRFHPRDYVYRIFVEGIIFSVVELIREDGELVTIYVDEGKKEIKKTFVDHELVETNHDWTRLAPMLKPRQEFPVTHLDGFIYAAGGMDDTTACCNALADFDKYDISSDRWTKCADLPVAVSHPGICAYNGKVYVFSGFTGGNYSEQGVTKKCFRYTPETDSWEVIASLPVAACAPGVVVYKDKIYVFGGDPNPQFDNAGNRTVYEYDPAKDTWKLVNNNMPHGRMHIGAGLIGDKVYLTPGRPGRIAKSQDDVVQEFDFTKMHKGEKAWRVMNPLPEEPRTGYISNWPVVNGKLYYIGGEQPKTYSMVHVFTPDESGGKWMRIADYPTTLHGIGPVAVGNKIYVCGGAAGGGIQRKTSSVFVYTVFDR